MQNQKNKQRPVLRGTITGITKSWYPVPGQPELEAPNLTLEVWCPFCQDFHTHGWEPSKSPHAAEYRTAHCSDDSGSPFNETGYFIAPFSKGQPGYSSHKQEPGNPITRRKRPSRK